MLGLKSERGSGLVIGSFRVRVRVRVRVKVNFRFRSGVSQSY